MRISFKRNVMIGYLNAETRAHMLLAFFFMAGSSTLLAQTESCLLCHDDPELTLERGGEEISLSVSPDALAGTPHDFLDCTDCHAGLDENELPHADPIPPAVVSCLDCHDDLAGSHVFHPAFSELNAETMVQESLRCGNCHGVHQIKPVADPEFPFSAERQTSKCGICHEAVSIDYLHSAHARALEEGAESAPACLDCHKSEPVMLQNGRAEAPRKALLAELCLHCHVDDPEVAGQTLYGTPFITSFENSVHGRALYSGNENAPTCIDCHGSHAVARSSDQVSHVSKGQVVKSCSQCHEQAAEDYLHSIHAKVLAKGYLDAPVCTDCHGEHNILAHTDPESPVASANLAELVCGECHGSVKLTERFGLSADRVETFQDSFHGLATRGGAVEAVNCASCHGYHDVRTEEDPESLVHPDNLAATCGQCHEGANERFAQGKVHVSIDRASEEPVLYWIATLYTWAIVLIVGGMFLHNFLDFFHKVKAKARMHWGKAEHLPDYTPHRLYLRLTFNERIQHALLALSFVVLVLTGFMLRYPEAWWVEWLRQISSHIFELRGITHRIAGLVMLAVGIWHISYVSLTKRGRQVLIDLLPRMKDLSDMMGVLRYNLGLAKKKPLFDRFTYIEKTEYWALMWGSIIMTVTGFLLWYENVTIGLLTKLGFDISRTVHFYEAVLATLAIVVWHFYFVIFNPDVYPMNLSWLTGYLSEEEMESEHPLELQRLREKEAGKSPENPPNSAE